MLRAAALCLTCAVLALTGAACGQSGSGGDGDPASLVPPEAVVHVQTAVQPEGQRREDALAAAGKILRTDDPARRLRELVDGELRKEGSGLEWERDFGSWLGEDASVWATNLEAAEPSYAVIVASKDEEAATAALQRFEKADEVGTYTKRSYEGVDYRVDEEGMAAGVLSDFVVIGTEAAFKRSIDTQDGESLTETTRYEEAVGELEDDRLGHYFMDLKSIVDAALEQDPRAAQQIEQFKAFFPLDKLGPVVGSFQADGDGMALDTVMTKFPDGPLRKLVTLWSGSETGLLSALPGDAWGAFATPKLGAGLQQLFNAVAGAIGGAAVADQVRQATGLNLQDDVFAWMGDVGVFARGSSESDLNGALVIESIDDAKAATAFGKLVGLLARETGTPTSPVRLAGAESAFEVAVPGAPQEVILARGQGRVVAAFGERAATDALDPSAKLGDAALYGEGKEALGDLPPSFLLSMDAVLRLVEATGGADADFRRAKPYLETIGAIASGGRVDGDKVRSRVAASLE